MRTGQAGCPERQKDFFLHSQYILTTPERTSNIIYMTVD